MEHGWTGDGGPQDDGDPDLDAEVFRRVFGYLPAPGVKVPRFSSDWDMATAVLSHVREAWRPLSIDVRQRPTTDPVLAWEVNIRAGKESGYVRSCAATRAMRSSGSAPSAAASSKNIESVRLFFPVSRWDRHGRLQSLATSICSCDQPRSLRSCRRASPNACSGVNASPSYITPLDARASG
jgi:hypothetical protein